jgi:sarcosine oxidase subunit beta
MPVAQYDLVVVGGGVWGVSAAAAATAAGARVALLEARAGVASEASAKAGGIVTDLLWHPEDRQWVAESRALYEEAERQSGDPTLVQRLGMVTLADPARHQLLHQRVQALRDRGVGAELLGYAEFSRRFPDLAVVPDDRLALWLPGDWHVNPTAYAQQTVAAARDQGLTVFLEAPVATLAVADDHVTVQAAGETVTTARVLVAAGAWSKKLVRTAGFDLPLRPYRVQLASLALDDRPAFPMVWDLATDIYIVPDGVRSMLAGDGTRLSEHDPDTYDQNGDVDFHEDLATHVPTLVRAGATARLMRSWAGAVGATPDRRPLIGSLTDRLYVACGDNGFGVMRGPAIGRLAGLIAVGEEDERPHLSPRRVEPSAFPIRPGFTLED